MTVQTQVSAYPGALPMERFAFGSADPVGCPCRCPSPGAAVPALSGPLPACRQAGGVGIKQGEATVLWLVPMPLSVCTWRPVGFNTASALVCCRCCGRCSHSLKTLPRQLALPTATTLTLVPTLVWMRRQLLTSCRALAWPQGNRQRRASRWKAVAREQDNHWLGSRELRAARVRQAVHLGGR